MNNLKTRTHNLVYHISLSSTGKHKKDSYHLDYENKVYRQDDLTKLIRDTVIFFALTANEIATLKAENLAKLHARAWSRISDRPKKIKGDYGEVLLFLILETFYPARKFVTKARLRTSKGHEIYGYDCAHFTIDSHDEICLWLGEAKFYQDFSGALTKAVDSINDHLNIESIKNELSLLEGNIDIQGDDADKLENFLNSGLSIDKMKFRIPVLLTYDSKCVKSHDEICDSFKLNLVKELNDKHKSIDGKKITIPKNVELHFILLALETVSNMKNALEDIEKAMK